MKLSRKKRVERVKRIIKYLLALLVVFIILLFLKSFLYPKMTYLCSDNVTKVQDLEQCPKQAEPEPPEAIKKECPVCNDSDACTEDTCSEGTDYKCVYKPITPCLGNKICEPGEYKSPDCPDCDDKNECTQDILDYEKQACYNRVIDFCCGNNICELNESYINCKKDCKRLLKLEIIHSSKETTIKNFFSDLTGSDKVFLDVKFKLTNLAVENNVTLITGENGIGYYFDPFKIKAKDENGKYYSPDYDSDLLPSYLDYSIVRNGQRVEGHLAYAVPKNTKHLQLIAQDQNEVDLEVIDIFDDS